MQWDAWWGARCPRVCRFTEPSKVSGVRRSPSGRRFGAFILLMAAPYMLGSSAELSDRAGRGTARTALILIDVQVGDVVVSWRGHAEGTQGEQINVSSPFDLRWIEIDQAPRKPSILALRRGRRHLDISAPTGHWDLIRDRVPDGRPLDLRRSPERAKCRRSRAGGEIASEPDSPNRRSP